MSQEALPLSLELYLVHTCSVEIAFPQLPPALHRQYAVVS